jgi:NAD(P)-dependent dehydrogenase (short-subunit alcohol dehydrogenase family)
MEFSGKTAIITGASGGIGLAIAMAMSDRGFNVVLAAKIRRP